MKTLSWLASGFVITGTLLAQTEKNIPTAATTLQPPVPLSRQTAEKIEAMIPIFDGRSLDGWIQVPPGSWAVKDGAMASLGTGRGVIYTEHEYSRYRILFTMRHLGGPPGDHAPCVLIFGTKPPPGGKGLDALGGIQFQPPKGGSWDYRPGKNNNGKGLFTRLVRPEFDSHQWHQVELLVDAATGTARMAVAQPVGTRAVEVLAFKDPTAGRKGPIAWQMHNKGLFDEYKDVRIEENPAEDKLITVEVTTGEN